MLRKVILESVTTFIVLIIVVRIMGIPNNLNQAVIIELVSGVSILIINFILGLII